MNNIFSLQWNQIYNYPFDRLRKDACLFHKISNTMRTPPLGAGIGAVNNDMAR
jgi:hypothetical protein